MPSSLTSSLASIEIGSDLKDKVYFAAGAGRIKIGTTTGKVTDRITAINAHLARPLKIIGFVAGGLPLERAVQKHLKAWHLKGEWFRDGIEIRTIIDRIIAMGPRAIGYEGDCSPVPEPDLRPSLGKTNPKAVGGLARLMWGAEAEKELAAFAGADEATAATWLDDKTNMPRLVRYAFASLAMAFAVIGEPPPSFTNPEKPREHLRPH